ncbi:hypothetical protein BGZ49_010072 [Haplosporangium sp. Z 27]|nr:hypothetical protein BGZ49_010072 [Haplosporangium sp. Z 27]
MFDILELVELIVQNLCRGDLSRCARVNKLWYRSINPFLWGDTSEIYNKAAFRRIVLEDYLEQQETSMLSPLKKYSHWIQKIPPPEDLLEYFESPDNLDSTVSPELSQSPQQGPQPSKYDLLHHFLMSLSNLDLRQLTLIPLVYTDTVLLNMTIKFILPHVRHLRIKDRTSDDVDPDEYLMTQELKRLLRGCSRKLQRLTFDITRLDVEIDTNGNVVIMESKEEEEESMLRIQPKELAIEWCELDDPDYLEFWYWFWKHCGSVELLEVGGTNFGFDHLVEGISTHMLSLNKIQIGMENPDWLTVSDSEAALLLSSCRNEWKDVRIKASAQFSEESSSVLVKSFPTIQQFVVPNIYSKSKDLIHILSSAPNLQVLNSTCYPLDRRNLIKYIECDDFIDLDPETGSLKTWACENSLKILEIKIIGIPRPDSGDTSSAIKEIYPGQGREIQSQVYERLGRFINLEKLWLGHRSIHGLRSSVCQRSCLEMSLESGLYKLGGLKNLRELSIANMCVNIGMKEIRWMAENWPKLRIIYGDIDKGYMVEDGESNNTEDQDTNNEYYCNIGEIKDG